MEKQVQAKWQVWQSQVVSGVAGAELVLGTNLVPVTACKRLLHLWPSAWGQAAAHPHGRGDAASLQAA